MDVGRGERPLKDAGRSTTRPASRWRVAHSASLPALILTAVLAAAPAAAYAARGFELVTPADDGPYDVSFNAMTPDGERAYWSAGTSAVVAGSDDDGEASDVFTSLRTPSAWTSAWITPYCPQVGAGGVPYPDVPPPWCGRSQTGVASFMWAHGDRTVVETTDGVLDRDRNAVQPFSSDAYLMGAGRPPELLTAGPAHNPLATMSNGQPSRWAVATDLSTTAFLSSSALVAPDGDATVDVYANVDGVLRLVSARSASEAGTCPIASCTQASIGSSAMAQHAVSANGRRIFFTTNKQLTPNDADPATVADVNSVADLYVWEAGMPRLMSKPATGGDRAGTGAVTFEYAAADGRRAFFTTTDRLADEATAGIRNVYAVDVATGELHVVSTGAAAAATFVAASADGSHALFATATALDGAPASASPKLYRWGPSGTDYVGTLSPGDPLLATNVWARPVRATADGSTFVFSTSAPLADANAVADVYAFNDEGLRLVSERPDGAATYDAVIAGGTTQSAQPRPGRGITDDGERIFFVSREALTPNAGANGRLKVYENVGGEVELISSGGADAGDATYLDASSDGSIVLFATRDKLVSADADGGALDIYAAHIGGGFSEPPPRDVGTAPEVATPAPGHDPSIVGTSKADGLSAVIDGWPTVDEQPGSTDRKPLVIAARRLRARGRALVVPVRLPSPGTLVVVVHRRGNPAAVLARTRLDVDAGGPRRVMLTLNRNGVRELRRGGWRKATVVATLAADDERDRAQQRRVVWLRGDQGGQRRGRSTARAQSPDARSSRGGAPEAAQVGGKRR